MFWKVFLTVALLPLSAAPLTAVAQTQTPPQPREKLPLVMLVSNRESSDVFVYPPSAIKSFQQAYPEKPADIAFRNALQYKPVPALMQKLHTKEEINSLSQPLEARAAVYVQTILRGLGRLPVSQSPQWAATTLKVVQRLASLDTSQRKSPRKLKWPPSLPLLMTELKSRNGILLVVEVRNDTQAGVLEKLDFFAFRKGNVTRTYWSRDMHDPTLFKPTSEAIAQVSKRFVDRLYALKESPAATESLQLRIHRTVGDRQIVSIQKIVQDLLGNPRAALKPTSFTRDEVFYTIPLPAEEGARLRSTLSAQISDLKVEALDGQSQGLRIKPLKER